MRVIVTRPAEQARLWVDALVAHGVNALALPLMRIEPALQVQPVVEAWRQLPASRLVFFVSANAVEHFFALRPAGADWPDDVLAGSTGPGTTEALRQAGLPAARIIEPPADSIQFDSESLWQHLKTINWQAARVQVVRGDGGREWLADTLREHGASVHFVAAYRRAEPHWDAPAQALLAEALAQPERHLWLFSSSEAIQNLTAHLRERAAPICLPEGAVALASHPRIAAAARNAGFSRVLESRPGVAEVVASLQSFP
jgi:uroporphyrinogen-III synthase